MLFVNPIAGIVALLYKNNSGFRKWANDIIKSIIDGLKSGWTNITEWIGNVKRTISKDINSLLAPIVKGIQEFSKPIIKVIQKICKDVGLILEVGFWLIWGPIRLLGQQIEKGIRKLWKWVQPYISKAVNTVGDIIGKLVGVIQGVWNNLNKITQKALNVFGKYIVDPIKSATNKARDAIDWLKNRTIDIFNVLSKATKKVFDTLKRYIINPINDAKNKVISLAKNIWDSIVNRFDSLCQETSKIWQKIRPMIITPITDTWHKVTKVVANLFDDVIKWWDRLKDGTVKKWDQMLSYVTGIPKKMGDALKNGAHWVGDGAKAIGNYMIGKIGDGVNGVIGGIDWVLDKVHAPKSVRLPKWKVPQFATGGTHGGGLMMVNDGEGPELIRHPSGKMEIPNGKNVIMHAEPGTQVLNHQQTKNFAQLIGIPMYANGIGNFFGGIWDGLKDIGEDVATAVAHPIKFVKKAIAKHVKLSATHPVLDIAIGGVRTMADGTMDWIKKVISKFGNKLLDFDGVGKMNAPSGSGVQRWKDLVIKALKANGLSTSEAMVAKILRQIATESGGNENARQPGTDPDGDGSGPALGLMQTKRNTFNAYKFPGHGNIFNGYDSLLAGLKYAKARYGSDLSFLGQGHGYANGGWADRPSIFGEIKNEPEVAINPKRGTADHLIVEAIQARAKEAPTSFSGKMMHFAAQAQQSRYQAVGVPYQANYAQTTQMVGQSTQNNGDIHFKIALDNGEIFKAQYPLHRAMQQHEIILEQAKGAGI